MSEKKPGFLERLFGRPTPVPADPPPAQPLQPAPPADPLPERFRPEPESDPATPPSPPPVPPQAEPDEDLPPGPPETTPEYVEEIEEEQRNELAPQPDIDPAAPPARQNWFSRLTGGLKRSSDQLATSIGGLFTRKKLDAATLDELEDILIGADLGLETATAITGMLRAERYERDVSAAEVRQVLATEVEKVLDPVARPLVVGEAKPFVILMVGVNGSGKTTTIGKLAQKLHGEGKRVLLAAGDTFRAAAIEQLGVWAERTGSEIVTRPAGSDASGLVFDAVETARSGGHDVLIIDTAGRLQNRDELMSELEKIVRVIRRQIPEAPHATLLTLDATTGQNALNQVEIFGKRAGVTGLVMTKLDGTARGGILVAIARKFGLPVHFIGVGEGVDDLQPFAARDFARAIAGEAER
jgi:fused signal recognition particle receptor